MNLIYMYKQDLALNNLQWLICHEKNNQSKPKRNLPENVLQDTNYLFGLVWFGLVLVTFFNDMLIFVGYLMPTRSL